MQFGAGSSAVSAAFSSSGKPALLLLTATESGRSGAGRKEEQDKDAPLPALSPSDVEATLLSAPGRPRAHVSATFPHGVSGSYVVALDVPSNYTGEVSVVIVGGAGGGRRSGSSGSGSNGDEQEKTPLSPLTFAVVRSPRVLVTASLPV